MTTTTQAPTTEDLPPDLEEAAPVASTPPEIAPIPEADPLAVYNPFIAEVRALVEECQNVPAIAGPSDKSGYALVDDLRKKWMRMRTSLESFRSYRNEEALAFQRSNNAKAKSVVAIIEKFEAPLKAEKKRIDDLIEAEKAKKQREIDDRIASRIAALNAVGVVVQLSVYKDESLASMREETFQAYLAQERGVWEAAQAKAAADAAELVRLQTEEAARQAAAAEVARVAREAEDHRMEEQRKAQAEQARVLAAQQADQERIAREQAQAAAKLEEQARALKAQIWQQRATALRAVLAEVPENVADISVEEFAALLEAGTQAKAARDKVASDKAAADTKAIADKAAKDQADALAAAEALKPDMDKLREYGDRVYAVALPDGLSTEAGKAKLDKFVSALSGIIAEMNS